MKKLTLISTILCLMTIIDGYSQSVFRKKININERDRGRYISQTCDGGYIITGDTWNYGHPEDVLLVKTNMYGDTIWTKSYGESDHQIYSYCVKETFDGGFILAAHTNIGDRAWIIRTDAVGDTLWTRYLSSSVYDILQTSDSCYFLVGEGNNSNWGDGAITKMDQSGEIKWSKFYNESKCFYQALEISDDEIMIGGLSRLDQAPNSTTIDLFKINHNGDSLWLKQYGDIHIFSYLSLQNTFDGGYILASTRALWGEDDNIYLQKVDSMGNLEWFKLYGEEFYSDYATSVVQTSDSGYMMTGYKENSGLYLLKTNHYGDSLWEKSFNTDTTSTKGYCLIKTADDHYAVIGEELEQYYPGFSDLIFLKADQEGLVTGLNIERKRNEVIVAPNPNQGDFYVQLSEGDREIMIFDMNGVLVFKQKTSKYDGPTVKIANLKQGTYLIQIKSQKATRVAKVVVL